MPYVESNRKVYYLGEPESGFPPRGPIQEFTKLKDELTKAAKKTDLFKDPTFPASSESLVTSKESVLQPRQYTWKRPKELDNNPMLVRDGPFRVDSLESGISECWLASAIVAMARNEKCFQWVVPRDQSFSTDYSGIFHFRIWAHGKWIDVVVDDRVPVCIGHSGETFLLNLAPRERIEFWQTLLVKAYAKLLGSYEAVYRSTMQEVLEDLTACISETVTLSDSSLTKESLITSITACVDQGLYMICNSLGSDSSTQLGLLREHPYCITDAKLVKSPDGQMLLLLKLYNSCKKNVWKGRFSRQDPKQEPLTSEMDVFINKDVIDICLTVDEFMSNFKNVLLLNITPESPAFDSRTPMDSFVFQGEWIRGANSGGGADSELFWINPQYEIELKTPEDKDTQCYFAVHLSKKFRFIRRPEITHSFAIFKSEKRLTPVKTSENAPVLRSIFVDTSKDATKGFIWPHDRPTCGQKVKLPPGVYVIAPLTTKDVQEAEFCLRVVSRKKILVRECKTDDDFYEVSPDDELPSSAAGKFAGMNEKGIKEFQKAYVKNTREELPLQWHQAEKMFNAYLKSGKSSPAIVVTPEFTRAYMALLDRNCDAVVDLPALKNSLDDLRFWKQCFTQNCNDGGAMKALNFNAALMKTGFHLPSRTLKIILRRHLRADGSMSFNNFASFVSRARWATRKLNERKNKKGCIEFTLDEWFLVTLYS